MVNHPLAAVKPRRLEIPFDAAQIEVVAGTGEAQQAAAKRIAEILAARCGAPIDVAGDAAYAGWDVAPPRHAILVGSLGDNRAIEFLYHRWLTFVDRAYPGAGGYVLTTLWEPWGKGTAPRPNALVVGAADPDGLDAAVARFEQIVAAADGAIPHVHEVVYGPSLAAEKAQIERWAERGHPQHGWRYPYVGNGQLYHVPQFARATARSGDRRMEAGLRELLLDLARSPVMQSSDINVHLYHWPIQMAWPLLETSPVYSDEDRLTISRFLYDVIVSTEGYRSPRLRHVLGTPLPRQNHETLCCLGVTFGAAYFDRHYDLPEMVDAWAVADGILGFGAACSKQIEDNNQHGWDQCIGDFAAYALITGKTGFFDNGMARLAANRAIANCSSNGFVATAGDGTVDRYPYFFLAQTAFYLRDPGIRFVCENVAAEIDRSGDATPARLPYDAGLPAAPPADHAGTRVFPLDRHYYDIPRLEPGKYEISAPNVPHAQTFDVLSMRSGWGRSDQHLILDGTGGGSHSYEDANAILMLTQDDRFLLLSPDRLYFTAPRDHNMVTVTRNGLGARLPSFSRLDAVANLPSVGFTATTLVDYAGTDWTRSILWRRGDFFLVVDRVVAREAADYSATCRWFGLGRAELEDGVCVMRQSAWRGRHTDFVIHEVTGAATHLREAFYGAPSTWHSGVDRRLAALLRTDRTNLAELDQRHRASLDSGEAIQFVNVLYARSGERVSERLTVQPGASGWLLIDGEGGPYATFLAPGAPQRTKQAGLTATCRAVVAWPGGVAAAGCTALRLGRLSLLLSSPCGVEVSPNGTITLDVPDDLTAIWRLPGGDGGELDVRGGNSVALHVGPLALPDPRTLVAGAFESSSGAWGLALRQAMPGGGQVPALRPPNPGGEQGLRPPAALSSRANARPRPPRAAPPPLWTATGARQINELRFAALYDRKEELLLAACEGNELVALAPETGKRAWNYVAGAPINCVDAGTLRRGEAPVIVIGREDELVVALDSITGHVNWWHRVEFGHPFWPWWSWYNASVMRVRIEDVDRDGKGEVIVAAGNMHVLLLDADGQECWRFRSDHGLFLTFAVIDLDGDGKKEIVGGNNLLSSRSLVRVIGADGTQKHTFENSGWTSQVRDLLVADIDGDGAQEVVCAVNRGENLRVHSLQHGRRWGHYLGEVPAGLALLNAKSGNTLFVATEGATALGLSPDGQPQWTLDVSPGATRVVRAGSHAAVILLDGTILRVDAAGNATCAGRFAAPVTAGAWSRGLLALGGADGSLAAFRVD